MLPSLPVSGVVNVQVTMSPKAAALRNFGAMLILGSSDVIDTDERIRLYSSIDDVAADFGTSCDEYEAAAAFFAQAPRPSDVRIGRWAKSATHGACRGSIRSTQEQDISVFKGISSGAFDITIDDVVVHVSAINLSGQSNLNGVASAVTAGMKSKATVQWNGERFIVTSNSVGAKSKVAAISSTELSQALGLSNGAYVDGIANETLKDALVAMLEHSDWYGVFIAGADISAEDAMAAATTVAAASPARICAFTSLDSQELDGVQVDSKGYKLAQSKNNRAIVAYSSTNKSAAMSILGRMSTVNFEGNNTAITLKFKQCPTVTPERLLARQAKALDANHVNAFVAYQNDTAILQEGVMCGGDYIDEIHGLDWLQNRVQTDLFNLLYTSATKFGQDESGMNAIMSTITKSLEQGVANGLIAPGVWGGDDIGALHRGDTLSAGYYIYIQPLEEQSQAEREARKAPVTQIAIKLKGAVHHVDVLINVNR